MLQSLWQFLIKLGNPIAGYEIPGEIKMYVHTRIFTAAQFIITPNWKQLRCSSTGEWIDHLWHIYTMECDSVIIKRRKLSIPAKTCENLKKC